MEISTRKQKSIQVIKLNGTVRLGAPADQLKQTFESLISEGEVNFVLVMNDVPTIDSSAIGVLMRQHLACKQQGGEIKLAGLSKFVSHTLNLVKILDMFDVHPDEASALAAFED